MISCPDPEVPAGGYMEAYDYNVHSTIDFHCEKGHKLVGEPNLTCQSDGEWSGESPKCDCKQYKNPVATNLLYKNCITKRPFSQEMLICTLYCIF